MNKKVLIIPLLAASLILGCNNKNSSQKTEDPSSSSSEPTSQSSDPSTSSSPTSQSSDPTSEPFTPQHAGTLSDPLSAADAKGLCDQAGSGVVVNNKEYYITGKVDTGSTVNAQYHQWYGQLDNGTFKISGATNDSGLFLKEEDGKLDGREVVVKGYIELYEGEYKVGYLPASASPTGKKYVPSLVSISGSADSEESSSTTGGETGGGVAGSNASLEGTIPENAKTLTFDFSGGTIQGISATSSSSPEASGVATVNNYQFNFANAIAHAPSQYINPGYLGLCAKGASAVASFANKTAIPGKIVKVAFTMPSDVNAGSGSVSSLAPFVIDFGTSALGSTGATSGGTGGSGVTLGAFATGECSYFSISVIKGVSSKGAATWYNGYIASIVVTYVD